MISYDSKATTSGLATCGFLHPFSILVTRCGCPAAATRPWQICAGRSEEGAVLCKRLLPALETLVRDNPGNNLYRNSLLRAYRLAVSSALDFEQKVLNLEPPTGSPAAWESHGLRSAHSGSLELRPGNREVALKIWRDTLAGWRTWKRAW